MIQFWVLFWITEVNSSRSDDPKATCHVTLYHYDLHRTHVTR